MTDTGPATDTDTDTDPDPDSDRTNNAPATNASESDLGRTVSEERSLSRMRQTIADHFQESSRNAVHVTISREIDAETLLQATESAATTLDADISVFDLVLRAVSATLGEHPAVNATFEDETHVLYEEHNIGIAIDIEAGLVTPVLRHLDSKSLAELATERRRLTERVQEGEYSMRDLRGGTFTVSNLGVFGVDSLTPISNPPEIAILGVNRIRERAQRGSDGVVFRNQLPVDLSFDHRLVDGADAARFLETFAEHVENSDRFVPAG
ncbi:2-oxo acid dehydrogenase subunit E2 [Natrialba aegyptia]|uniref:Dihydrolipoyllysine-residue acetyltransferase n=1 Tax=Natrialba aegyptia DSM 13077 TaxID=1227491 RepID=M0AGK5_9EURY|nr:2-oxo acid dehydrogenase subunit E2 [Natrialba aegyptia]ELY97699.1 dihydrolipoyllysine-residue acetyltransferase [Natrialba aegyptia DSM 13077]